MSRAYPVLAQRGFVVPTRLKATAYESAGTRGARAKSWQASSAGPNASVVLRHMHQPPTGKINNGSKVPHAIADGPTFFNQAQEFGAMGPPGRFVSFAHSRFFSGP